MGLAEPKTVSYLNFAENFHDLPTHGSAKFSATMFLSTKVTIQKRTVYDIFMMFGEVGGLRDFIFLILAPFLSLFSERFLLASIVSKLYHIRDPRGTTRSEDYSMNPAAQKKPLFEPLNFSTSFILAHACSIGWCLREKALHRKTLLDGISRLEDSLDIVKLVR